MTGQNCLLLNDNIDFSHSILHFAYKETGFNLGFSLHFNFDSPYTLQLDVNINLFILCLIHSETKNQYQVNVSYRKFIV